MKRLAITVSGRVQGVFYRASTKKQADSLGVCGFVKNESNGDVYIEAESDELQLEKFLSWCHQGPPHAIVRNVLIEEKEPIGLRDFEIRR